VLRTNALGRGGRKVSVAIQTGHNDSSSQQETITTHSSSNSLESTINRISPGRRGVETQTLERARHENPYHLNTLDILLLREQGILLRLPYISPEELQDRSKSDSLVRVIAIIQIAGMILQILARAVRHLVISQLEIAVIAFASCAIVMYVLNWDKPKGIQVPITILQYSGEAPKEVSDLLSFFSTQV
jgi:hypothetical protein